MTTRTLSEASLDIVSLLPPSKRGPGYRTVSINSYSSSSSISDATETVDCPTDFNSLEFLLFAGFSESAAHSIWENWQTRNDRPHWLVEDALYYVKEKARTHDAISSTDDWDKALQSMGMSKDMCSLILHPDFDSLRLSGCACFWACDTVNEAFAFLSTLSDRIEEKHAINIERVQSPNPGQPPSKAKRTTRTTRLQATTSIATIATTRPINIENCTILYKGGAEARLAQVQSSDGNVRIAALHSAAPTDFHPEKGTHVYLTKQKETAVKYAQYVQTRLPPVKSAILHIAIPQSITSNMVEVFGEDWLSLVWHSRNISLHATTYKQLPNEIRHYQDAPICVGNICHDSTHKISRMADKSELSIMRLSSGAKASQMVIQSIETQKEISEQCKGKVWLEVL